MVLSKRSEVFIEISYVHSGCAELIITINNNAPSNENSTYSFKSTGTVALCRTPIMLFNNGTYYIQVKYNNNSTGEIVKIYYR